MEKVQCGFLFKSSSIRVQSLVFSVSLEFWGSIFVDKVYVGVERLVKREVKQ